MQPSAERHTLFLACTRPAMFLGAPAEAVALNICGTAFFTMIVGRGNPVYYLIFLGLHVPMVVLANRNANFFQEWRAWWLTFAQAVSDTLFALPIRKEGRIPTSV